MKLIIITGKQGSGKTEYLNRIMKDRFSNLYTIDRLEKYPLHLPGVLRITEFICFDEVKELADFYKLAAICAEGKLMYKTHTHGYADSREDITLFIATQRAKKELQQIFKPLKNVAYIDLNKEKKTKLMIEVREPKERIRSKKDSYKEFTILEEIRNQFIDKEK